MRLQCDNTAILLCHFNMLEMSSSRFVDCFHLFVMSFYEHVLNFNTVGFLKISTLQFKSLVLKVHLHAKKRKSHPTFSPKCFKFT